MIRYLLLICIVWTSAGPISAQQISEDEINRQKLFIEAEREKLLGNYDKAIGILRELHRQESDNPGIAYELGRLNQANGNTEEAVRFLKMAGSLDPTNEWYPKYLADIYQEAGRNQEGADLYAQLIERKPDDQYLYFKQAFFLVKAQQIDKALRVYEELEKRTGLNEEIARRKHTLYLGQGDTRKAARVLEELVEAYPRVIDYRYLLAAFYESQGDDNAARKVYAGILELDPEDPKALLAMAGGSNIQRDEIRLLEQLRPIFERADVPVDLKISKLYPFITKVVETRDVGLADAALELTSIMQEVHNSDAKAFSAAADLYYHSGRLPQALAMYKETLDRDESVFPVWEQLLQTLYDMGDFEHLYTSSNDALDLFPNQARVQFFLALAADGLARYDDAMDALSMADLMAGRDANLRAEVLALQGQVYRHQGDKSGAATAFKEARALAPKSPEVQYRYSEHLVAQGGDLKEAAALAKSAMEAAPDHPYYAYAFANATYAKGDYAAAATALTQARTYGAEFWPSALELSGDVEFQLKNTDQAVNWWQRAREISGPSERLDEKIAKRSL